MARKRMIDPNIWASEDFSKLSTLAKLVFIGIFSNADDEGRGKAKAVYLKSILFPYEEAIRVADVDKTLSEIGSNMSVTFYSNNGNEYYQLNNWDKWQKVDRPTPSMIPELNENSTIIRRAFDECSTNPRRVLAPNRIEQNRTEKEKNIFIKPTIAEIKDYCLERKNSVDAEKFFDFYESKGWLIGKNPMKDWKASIRTWERSNKSEAKPTNAYHNSSQSEFNELDKFYSN